MPQDKFSSFANINFTILRDLEAHVLRSGVVDLKKIKFAVRYF